MENILLLISAAIFVTYTMFIAFKYGIQKSISESYYRLPNNQKALFTLALWGFAIPVVIVGGLLESVWLFLAGSLITLVGAAPTFKGLLMTFRAHMFGAYGGILLGMIGISLLGEWKWVIAFVISSIILRFAKIKYIWWIEYLAFFTVLLGIYLN